MLMTIFGLDIHLFLRVFFAFWLSLAITLATGHKFIAFLHAHQAKGQPIRDDGPQSHLAKKGTPTMGGILILASAFLSTFIFADLQNIFGDERKDEIAAPVFGGFGCSCCDFICNARKSAF